MLLAIILSKRVERRARPGIRANQYTLLGWLPAASAANATKIPLRNQISKPSGQPQ